MPLRSILLGILLIVAIPMAFFLYDSHYGTITYDCGATRTFTLNANTPGNIHAADIRFEGSVHQGSVTVEGFPLASPVPQIYSAGASVADDYSNEMYETVNLTFSPTQDAKCDLRVTYRLASDFSMLNPLW